ncbi:MAG: nitrite/sulfite reductase [Gluconacetobacter diazotrophicus]|nr:nitrite/sulfite reductase [Gluconacetobacter diazotrophicus]
MSGLASPPVGTYAYDRDDRDFLSARVDEFSDQVRRRLDGSLDEDAFKPLRLMNGLYLQLHAYMLRVAIPYGVLTSRQLRQLAHVARQHDCGYAHFTTRQNVQFNWIRLEEAPAILRALADVDMHAIQTSGNCIRNITSDEFAGAAADELVDPRVHAEILRQWSTLHPEFSFLPRKFKIAISGSPEDRVAARFHDIGVVALRGPDGRSGFRIYAGGGLGRTPVIGILMREWLPEADLLAYMEAILRTYNAAGRRDNIYKARIKILVQAMGADGFRHAVEEEFARLPRERFRLDPAMVAGIAERFGVPGLDAPADAAERLADECRADPDLDRWVAGNTHPHRDPGYLCVVLSLKPPGGIPGDASAEQMDAIAELADRFSFGEIRVTHLQNLVLAHVRRDQVAALWRALRPLDLATPNHGLIGDVVACPGLDYCTLANARSIPIARRIGERFADPDLQRAIGPLRINVSGCINACGHHHAGAIGILGVDKKGEEFFQLTLGGSAGNDVAIGQILGPALPEDEAVRAVEKLVDAFLELRNSGEHFLDTYRRLGAAAFKEAVYAAA